MQINIFIHILTLLLILLFTQPSFPADGDLVWATTSKTASSITSDANYIYTGGGDGINFIVEKRNKSNGSLVWIITDNPTAESDLAKCIANDDNHIYVGIQSYSINSRIEKRNKSNGSLVWAVTGAPTGGHVTSLKLDDNALYLTGYINLTKYTTMGIIEKRNKSDGSLVWTVTLPTYPSISRINSITLDSNYLYIAGYDGDNINSTQWRIEKRNKSNGSLIWAVTSNPSWSNDRANSITSDSNYLYIAGYDSIPNKDNSQWRIEKRNKSNGSLIWAVTSNPSWNSDNAYSIASDSNYLYIAGYSNSFNDWRIEKRNKSDGSLVWTKILSRDSYFSVANEIIYDTNHIYIVGSHLPIVGPSSPQRIEKREAISGSSCPSTSTFSWTDPIINSSTKIKKAHLEEIRTNLNNKRQQAGLPPCSWTTINDKLRTIHIQEIRTCIQEMYTYCGKTPPSWTDPIITTNTKVKAIHFQEIRNSIEASLQ